MAKKDTINKMNSVINLLGKGEFTLDELISKFREKYLKLVRNKLVFKFYLRWPQINAKKIEDNGKYRRIFNS